MCDHSTTKTPPQKHKNTTPTQKHHHHTTPPQKHLYVWAACVSTMCGHSMCEQFMWARTPKSTKITTIEKWTSVLGPDVAEHRKVRKLARKIEHQFLGRMLQRQKRQKSTSFIVKTPFKSIAEHRKVRELPRKMNIEEVEAPKKYENLPDETRFRPFQEHRPSPQSTRITTKNEHRRSWRAGNYENLQTKPAGVGAATPETTKIHRRNELASTKPRK